MEGILNEQLNGAADVPTNVLQSEFEELHFSQRALNIPRNVYHVYRTEKDYEKVEANSAYEAMRESGIERPVRIQRYSIFRIPMLAGDMLADIVDQPAEPEMAAVSAPEVERADMVEEVATAPETTEENQQVDVSAVEAEAMDMTSEEEAPSTEALVNEADAETIDEPEAS